MDTNQSSYRVPWHCRVAGAGPGFRDCRDVLSTSKPPIAPAVRVVACSRVTTRDT